MRITPEGIPVGGVAGDEGEHDGVFVNATVIKDGGTATTGGGRVYYQSLSGDVRSCALDGSDDRPELESGATLIVAGGGACAGFLAGAGVVTSWGLRLRDAAVLDMTADGDLLVTTSYAEGRGVAMYRKGQVVPAWTLPDQKVAIKNPYPQAFALDADRVVWANAAGRVFTRGLPAPAQASAAVFDPFLIQHPTGAVWVGYHTSDDRLLIHPIDDASRGYIVATGLTYGTTATGGFVGYSRTPNESQMVVVPIDWSAELVSLAPVVSTAVPPDASTKLVAGAWGTTPETPGNLSVGPDASKAVICTIGEVGQIDPARLLALFVSDADASRDRQGAEELKVPLAIYVDDRDYLARVPGILDAVGDTPWIAILQCYIDCRGREGESLDRFAAEVAAQAQQLPVPWIAAVRCTAPKVDDVVVIPVERVIAAMNRLVPIVTDPRCLGWALFKWKRGDGVTGVPALEAPARAWLTGSPQLRPTQARTWAAEFYGPAAPPAEPVRFAITVHGYADKGTAPFKPHVAYTVEGAPGPLTVMLTLDGLVVGQSDLASGTLQSLAPVQAGEYRLGLTAVSNGRTTQTAEPRIVRVLPPSKPEIPGITYPSQPGSGTAEGARLPSQQAAEAAQRENEGDL